ncbi:MAG: hypothetical protein MJE77_37665 [Proteobacteria bacterium]|nr:hypothetical protein [Pseudomonadota bacterium]
MRKDDIADLDGDGYEVDAAVATIPPSVIGGSGLIMFLMIFASGISIIYHRVTLDKRTLVILAVSAGLGLSGQFRPDVLAFAADWAKPLFGRGLAWAVWPEYCSA